MKTAIETDLMHLPVADVSGRAHEETARYRAGGAHDDRFSHELFRRAIAGHDQCCWAELVKLYQELVLGWCRQAAPAPPDDLEDLAAQTWEKFWRHFTAQKLESAGSTAEILRYLKLCARSVAVDEARRRAGIARLDDASESFMPSRSGGSDLEEAATRATLWSVVECHLRDARERVLVTLRYRNGLTAAEVQARRPDLFADAAEVYRVSRNLLDRLRRSPAMRAWAEAA